MTATDDLATGFAPILGANPRVLVLGTLASIASMQAAQYYGHPRNAFWPIMGALFDAGPERAYPDRCERLTQVGIAVWDVLHSAVRPGSLDSAIDEATLHVNDFAGLFAGAGSTIHTVLFNGGNAERLFRRHVVRAGAALPPLTFTKAPSTSPAHAAMRPAQKAEVWRAALLEAGVEGVGMAGMDQAR